MAIVLLTFMIIFCAFFILLGFSFFTMSDYVLSIISFLIALIFLRIIIKRIRQRKLRNERLLQEIEEEQITKEVHKEQMAQKKIEEQVKITEKKEEIPYKPIKERINEQFEEKKKTDENFKHAKIFHGEYNNIGHSLIFCLSNNIVESYYSTIDKKNNDINKKVYSLKNVKDISIVFIQNNESNNEEGYFQYALHLDDFRNPTSYIKMGYYTSENKNHIKEMFENEVKPVFEFFKKM